VPCIFFSEFFTKELSYSLGDRGLSDKPGESCHVLSFGPSAVRGTNFTTPCHLPYTLSSLRARNKSHLVCPLGRAIWCIRGSYMRGYHSRVIAIERATNVISGVSSSGIGPVIGTSQHRVHTRDVANTQGRMEAQTKPHHLRRFWGARLEPRKLERHGCY